MTTKELRAKTKLTQKDFCKAFKIPVRTLQNWENGKNAPPEWAFEALECKVNAYLENKLDTPRNDNTTKVLESTGTPHLLKRYKAGEVSESEVLEAINSVLEKLLK